MSKNKQQLNVKSLITLLRQQPPDALVWIEGCDCDAEAVDVSYDYLDNSVMITRTKHEDTHGN